MTDGTALQKENKKPSNFKKKEKNSLKIDIFFNQFDFLHHSNQNSLIFAVHFLKITEELIIKLAKINFDFALNTKFSYKFIFQYLYPKHSFW
jgi:hypothetical protein